jgi:hypothetical protein
MKNFKRKIVIVILGLLLLTGGFFWYWNYDPMPRYQLEKLYITIDDEGLEKLEGFRDAALELGYLERSSDDYVKSEIIYRSQVMNGKVRLKGDWTDHLESGKWSFRIKLKVPMSDGLKTFSVQEPSTRGHLKGYMFHKLLKQEGILSNEFRFVNLFVNGTSWGAYCLEEHLSSRVLKSQNRPNGVILKFDDKDFFKAFSNDEETIGLVKNAKIKIYGDAKDDKKFKKQIEIAKQIIKDYQFQKDSMYAHFDAEKMGMYYALCDLAAAYHSMGWINIRFYYNFETDKMEPFAYDGYPIMEWGKPYLGHHAETYAADKYDVKMMVYTALKNEAIKAAYDKALLKVTDPKYVQSFMDKHKLELDFYHKELNSDNRHFHFYEDFLIDNATAIRQALHNK